MIRLALYTAVAIATLAAAAMVWQFRGAIVIFFVSLGVAAAVRPLIDGMARSGLPRVLGLAGTYLLGLVVVILLAVVGGNLLLTDLHRASEDFVAVHDAVTRNWPEGNWLQQAVARRIPSPDELFSAFAGEQGAKIAETALGTAFGVVETVVNVIVILVLSIYWSIDRVHFQRLWLSLLPATKRSANRELWHAVEVEIGAYFRSELMQSLLAAIALGLGYAVLGIRYPAALALVAALAWMVPWVGGLVVTGALLVLSVPMFLLGDAFQALAVTLLAGGYTLAILLALELLVEPRLFDRGRYNSLLMALAVIALADWFGILGILLGPPLAIGIQIVSQRLLRQRLAMEGGGGAPTSDLEQSVLQLRARWELIDSPPADLGSLLGRLDTLAGAARAIVPSVPAILSPEREELVTASVQRKDDSNRVDGASESLPIAQSYMRFMVGDRPT